MMVTCQYGEVICADRVTRALAEVTLTPGWQTANLHILKRVVSERVCEMGTETGKFRLKVWYAQSSLQYHLNPWISS